MDAKRRMIQKNKKNAFTLIEVLVSIVLLGIIFTYLYSTINSLKMQNNHYIQKSDAIKEENRLFMLLTLDIAQAVGTISPSHSGKYDIINFKSKNSIYGIIEPQIMYFVSKKDNTLIRVESLDGFDINNKDQLSTTFLYADILAPECESFKVANNKDGFISVLLRAKGLKPILLKIPTMIK
jgi:prepilin-type N-terminal cleavage/methylation domain-containing protein